MYRADKLIASLLCLFSASIATAMDITVEKPWVRNAPPTAEVLAAYMIINNHSDKKASLISLSSTNFKKVTLHKTSMHEGMMHMKAINSLEIEAGASIVLEPGGYHLMLAKPNTPISHNQQINLTLTFEDGKILLIAAPLKDAAETSQHGDDHHH